MTQTPFAEGQELQTSESPPRKLTVLGAWAMSPEMAVARTENGHVVHIYPTGFCRDLGRDVFLAETAEAAQAVAKSFA